MDEMFDFLAFHSGLPRLWWLPQSKPLRAAERSANVQLVWMDNNVVGDDSVVSEQNSHFSANC